jgi:hypothetical protein
MIELLFVATQKANVWLLIWAFTPTIYALFFFARCGDCLSSFPLPSNTVLLQSIILVNSILILFFRIASLSQASLILIVPKSRVRRYLRMPPDTEIRKAITFPSWCIGPSQGAWPPGRDTMAVVSKL